VEIATVTTVGFTTAVTRTGEGTTRKGPASMVGTLLVSMLLSAQTAALPGDVRAFVATITDDKGGAVAGLTAHDVAVLENVVARDLVSIEPDDRPITLALIIDTSEATLSALRLNVVEAASSFLKGLPEGSTFSIWTTSDRPTKVVDYTQDRAAAQKALVRLFPQGGNTLLDAIPEASTDLKKREGVRSVVVALTSLGPELSNRDRGARWTTPRKADLFMGVSFEEEPTNFRPAARLRARHLRRTTGGLETVLSPMALPRDGQAPGGSGSQYRLKYLSGPMLKDKTEAGSEWRPGVQVRVGRSKTS
jgi:hypothetical protein